MAAKGGSVDFMFLNAPSTNLWIFYSTGSAILLENLVIVFLFHHLFVSTNKLKLCVCVFVVVHGLHGPVCRS